MAAPIIPVNEPLFAGNEKRYLAECIDTGWVSSDGPFIARFEEGLADYVGRRHGIAVSSGSAALEIAFAALGIGQDDEVILPAFTIISCILPIIRAGAKPVLVDSDPITWNMDLDQVAARITPRTRAILAVHTYGLPVDMAKLSTLAARHGIVIIEDAAEMHGQTCHGRRCGSFGAISLYSFYPNKLITTGEGGALLTDDDALASRCRSLRNLCFRQPRFVHDELGWNYRMSNLQAAVGVAQLERIDDHVEIKRRMGARYTDLLKNVKGLRLPLARTAFARNIYWVYGVVMEPSVGCDAKHVMEELAARGVQTRPFFWPMHEQPVLLERGLFGGERYPVAESLARCGFYLPSGLALTPKQIALVAQALMEIIG